MLQRQVTLVWLCSNFALRSKVSYLRTLLLSQHHPVLVITHYIFPTDLPRVVLGWAYRGLTGGFLLLQNFSVAISVSPNVCFILV